MAFDYTETLATATSLLADFGQTMTLLQSDGGTYDPVTGAITGAADASNTFNGVKVGIETSRDLFDKGKADGLISGEMALILADPSTITIDPQTSSRVTFGGTTWRIFGVSEVNPAGTVVLYKFGVVRA